jgi:hypothetical protein
MLSLAFLTWFWDIYTSWTCIGIGVALIIILLIVFFILRNRREED